jgi:hydroxymethylbilane synthase
MNRNKSLVIGSRGSKLALAQARLIGDRIRELHPAVDVSLRIIKTTGDRMSAESLAGLAADTKGLFVKEIEEALLEGGVDLAVHSLKDLPTELPAGLTIGAFPLREDSRDCLVGGRAIRSPADLPKAARVGTSSLRRWAQIRRLRPDFEVVPIRGNVDTRIRKLGTESLDAVILAAAGLRRLGLEGHISYLFSIDEMIPAIGQGALAVEVRSRDSRIAELVAPLDDSTTRRSVTAERDFLLRLGGGCQVPMGAHAAIEGDRTVFSAFVAHPDGGELIHRTLTVGPDDDLLELVRRMAEDFLSQGAERILAEVKSR